MQKEVFFITDNFYPEHNAAASRIYERSVYWVEWGYKVTVLTSFPNFPEGKVYAGYDNKLISAENINGIDIKRVWTFIAPNQKVLLRLVDFLSFMVISFFAGLYLIKRKHSVIVASSPHLFTAVAGCFLAKIKGRPFVMELADLWPESVKAVGVLKKHWPLKVIEKLEMYMYREANLIIALTNAFKENLVRRGISEDKIIVIRNGVDLRLHKRVDDVQDLRSKLGLNDKFVVGYIGTHGLAHGLIRILKIAKKLHEEGNQKIKFLFVGSGADRKNMLNFVSAHKLENVVMVEAQSKEDISKYWSLLSTSLIHLKNQDTFRSVIPTKVFESMAYGLPIILIAPDGEAASVVNETSSGICVSDYDDENLLAIFKDLSVDNNAHIKEMSEKSIQASKFVTREKQALDYIESLRPYLSDSRPLS